MTAVPAGPETGATELMAGTGNGVTVSASVEVLNLRVTLCRLPTVFLSSRIPISRSVVFVVSVEVTRQLLVLTPVVDNAVLIELKLQSELRTEAAEFTCAKQIAEICILAFVVVFSTASARLPFGALLSFCAFSFICSFTLGNCRASSRKVMLAGTCLGSAWILPS